MRHPSLFPVYLSVVLWHIGGAMVIPFVSIWLRSEIGEASLMILGIILGLPNVIGIIGISVLSNFTDKRGYYRQVIFVINTIGFIEYLLLSQITHSSQYLLIAGIAAVIFPAYYTIIQAYATNICPPAERGRVTSNLMLAASIGWFFGASAGGVAFRTVGMSIVLISAAILFLLSGLAVLPSPPSPHLVETEPEEVTSTWALLRRKSIYVILLPMIIIDLSAGAIFVMGSVFYYERIMLSTDLIGYSTGIATMLASLLLLRIGPLSDRIGRRPFYLVGVILPPVYFLLLSLIHYPVFVFIILAIPTYPFLRPIVPAMMSDVTTPVERARGMSLVTITSSVSMLIGASIGGYIGDNFSIGLDIFTILPALFGWLAVISCLLLVKETLFTDLS